MHSIAQPKRSQMSSRMAGGVVIGLVALLGAALLILVFGMVHGEEFSPSGFRRRSFTYYEIPLLGGQISPVFREARDGLLSKHLQRHELIPISREADRWDVVYRTSMSRAREHGAAYTLCAYLDMQDEQRNPRWLVWTKDHPELAKVLWPEIAALAADQVYFAVPEMMECASLVTSPDQLRSELKTIAAEARQVSHATQPRADS